MSHSKQYMGTYQAEVMDVADPEKRCRVRVNVYDVFDNVPNDDLPWANFVLPLGSRPGEGSITPLKVGDKVWVQFVAGDSRRPIIMGSSQAAPGGKVNLAPEACQGEGQFEHKRTEKQPKPDPAPYYEDVVVCQNRALIQLCRSGNIRVTQMDSGSAVEILPDGKMVIHCEGDMFTSVMGNALEEYEGNLTQEIKGNLTQKISGAWELSAKKGKASGAGGLSFSGPTDFDSTVHVESDVVAGGKVIDSGGNTNHHSH